MRHNKIRSTIDGICNETIRHFLGEVAHLHMWTFERISAMKAESIFGHVNYAKLPQWAKSEIDGYWKAYDQLHRRKLIWTHCLDGERIPTKDPRLEGRHIEISQQEPNLSCFAYHVVMNDGKNIYVPELENERARDIEMGIFMNDTINEIIRGAGKVQ